MDEARSARFCEAVKYILKHRVVQSRLSDKTLKTDQVETSERRKQLPTSWMSLGVEGSGAVRCGSEPLTETPRRNELCSNRNDAAGGLFPARCCCAFQDSRCPLLVTEWLSAAQDSGFIVPTNRGCLSVTAEDWGVCLFCNHTCVRIKCLSTLSEQPITLDKCHATHSGLNRRHK